MILFRPSNNNQRYAFMPLLDRSDDEREDELEDEHAGSHVSFFVGRIDPNEFVFLSHLESTMFDSVSLRRSSTSETNSTRKAKKQQSANSNQPVGSVEDALNWVENNIPTSFADQALQALEEDQSNDEPIIERSKIH